jgi:parvulin-like peptidyl-prolyl isomerase
MRYLVLSFLAIQSSNLYAEVSQDLRIVAQRGGVAVTLQDIDTAVARIPISERASVVAGGDRLNQILDTELLNKQSAAHGRKMKLLEEPEVKRMIARAAEQELAKITLERVLANSPKHDFSVLAKEYYLTNQGEFSTPATSVVQHILISKIGRTASETLLRVNEVISKTRDGILFEDLVAQYSDDPSKSENNGVLSLSEPGAFVKPVEDVALALKVVGDVSAPIETEFGTHLLRLVSRAEATVEPFDFVKGEIIAKLESESLVAVQAKFFSDLRASNPVFHEDMLDVVRKRYGELPNIGAQPIAPSVEPAVEGTK